MKRRHEASPFCGGMGSCHSAQAVQEIFAEFLQCAAYSLVVQPFRPGQETVFDSTSHTGRWRVVFEDDTETAYLYALDLQSAENPIQEAMHIYNVRAVSDRHNESKAAIVWSNDGQKACLLINNHPHAVFDFEAKRGYCRTNFPPPGKWDDHDFQWDDGVLGYFKKH